MDQAKIDAFNEQQKSNSEELSKQENFSVALNSILDSQDAIDATIKKTILQLILFLKDNKAEVSVNNQQEFPSYDPVVTAIQDVVAAITESNDKLGQVSEKETDLTPVVESLNKLSAVVGKLPTKYPDSPNTISVDNQIDLSPKFDEVTKAIKAIDVSPVINVDKAKLDLGDMPDTLGKLLKAVADIKMPAIPAVNFSGMETAIKAVQQSIDRQVFPVPNFILPFKDANGKATQASLITSTSDTSKLGIIVTNPDGSNIGSSGSGGLTDAQLRATPVPISGTVTTTPTDVSALNKEATQLLIKAKTDNIPALGQALAASSTPVVLTAAQLTTLTPLSSVAVSNFPATQPISGTVTVSNMIPSVETGLAKDGTDITTPTSMPAGGAGIRGWLSAIWTKLNGTLAVTGTFFQATQPVSIAGTVTTTGGLTDAQLRATAVPVSLASTTVTNTVATTLASTTITGSVAVTGPLTDAQLRATAVPISGTVVTGDLTDTQLRANPVPVSGTVTVSNPTAQGLTDTQLRATAVPISLAVAPTTPVTGTFFQGTQPVSSASLPLPALASTSTKQSDGSQKGQIVDSTGNVVTVTGNRLDVNATISTAGLATSAIQTTQQTSLNTVTTDLDYRFSGGKTSYAAVLSASGDHTVITPTAGKRIQIYWIAFVPNSDNTISNLVTVKLSVSAINMYIGYALAHWELFTGAINEAVTINLTNTQPVAFTIHYKEIA